MYHKSQINKFSIRIFTKSLSLLSPFIFNLFANVDTNNYFHLCHLFFNLFIKVIIRNRYFYLFIFISILCFIKILQCLIRNMNKIIMVYTGYSIEEM